jgi:PBSX family phage portal protein
MAYLERRNSRLGTPMQLLPTLAKYMRRGVEPGTFFQVTTWKAEHEFEPGTVFQLREADIDQEIYGLPEWLSAMHAALLNESATLFRRKYYANGSHAGFILYLSDPQVKDDDVDALREALRSSRGPGNFRNLFLHSPNGKKDGLQLIPVSEVAAKDEFSGIKNITRDDVLAAMRIPPQLLGIVPQNAGGFGSIREASIAWAMNELEPLQTRMIRVNDWVGEEVIRFDPFVVAPADQGSNADR